MAVVAIDYTRAERRAMIVNGDGEVLRQPFTVSNNAEGVAFLLEAVRVIVDRHAIKPAQVIYGAKDEPSNACPLDAIIPLFSLLSPVPLLLRF